MDRRQFLIGGVSSSALFVTNASAVASNYEQSLRHVLVSEGGYSNNAHDPGGVTLNGVIQREYNRYRRNKGRPQRALTRSMQFTAEWIAERSEIYHNNYGNPVAFDELPAGLDYTMFDYAVNSGIGRAPKVLQRILRVPVTGRLGPSTLAAVKARDPKVLIRAVNDERLNFLRHLRTYRYFGPGWTRRVRSVRTISLLMSEGRRASEFGYEPAYGPGRAFEEVGMEVQ